MAPILGDGAGSPTGCLVAECLVGCTHNTNLCGGARWDQCIIPPRVADTLLGMAE